MRIFLLIGVGIILGATIFLFALNSSKNTDQTSVSPQTKQQTPRNTAESPQSAIIAQGLDTPWAIAFLPDRSMLVTERNGAVRFIDTNGQLNPSPIATIRSAQELGEGGLLGITLHPNFSENQFVYLYYTFRNDGSDTLNRVVRMRYENNSLTGETTVVDNIPGASNHNGGRIKFGPDNFLYIATGDAQNPSLAQNTTPLAGKILRVTDSGDPAPGNPFGNRIYSYGHRNVQGIAWSSDGALWATEHGRSGALSGFDELNLIEAGTNYGWPDIEGDETRSGMSPPRRHSGGFNTWAPSGAAFAGNSLFFSGLRGQALYEAVIDGENVREVKEHFSGEFGRIREVVLGPDGMLYITTSNRDGRGNPGESDDRIIRVNPDALE